MTDTFTLLGTTFNNVTGFRATDSDGVVQTFEQGGGASNYVHGTFTTGSTDGVSTLTIPYTGTGYPIMAVVVVAGGAYNSAYSHWHATVQRYAVGQWTMTKSIMSTAPVYTTTSTQSYGVVTSVYKSSTTSSTSYSRTSSMITYAFSPSAATGAALTCVRFNSNTTLSYYVNSSSYGLMADTDYEYFIVYSE